MDKPEARTKDGVSDLERQGGKSDHAKKVADLMKPAPQHEGVADIARTETDPMLQWFEYDHLPDGLKEISAPFGALAQQIINLLPRNPERTVALRKLLEAKDSAVRSKLFRA